MSVFFRLVVRGHVADVRRQIESDPSRPVTAIQDEFFLEDIKHQVYAGDTALHLAAAAFRRPMAELLVQRGASVRARNRRGAEPLHYAADANHWNPDAQADTIAFLIRAGADPDALNDDGVGPLHRAVRTRAAAAVKALLEGGADASIPNGNGSTPLQLATRHTGRSGSGSPRAREQQALIIEILQRVARR